MTHINIQQVLLRSIEVNKNVLLKTKLIFAYRSTKLVNLCIEFYYCSGFWFK